MPQFPGGEAALMKYIKSHLQKPQTEEKISGSVILQFVVQSDGSIGEVKVVRSLHPDYDKEAVSVVKSLPKFSPGRQNGQVVAVWYTLPVIFR
jgi:protein TonB